MKVLEQVAHFIAGFAISAFTHPLVSVAVAVGREIYQNWGDTNNDYADMALDLFVWIAGAIIASLVF